jgi:hypothetical protein
MLMATTTRKRLQVEIEVAAAAAAAAVVVVVDDDETISDGPTGVTEELEKRQHRRIGCIEQGDTGGDVVVAAGNDYDDGDDEGFPKVMVAAVDHQ